MAAKKTVFKYVLTESKGNWTAVRSFIWSKKGVLGTPAEFPGGTLEKKGLLAFQKGPKNNTAKPLPTIYTDYEEVYHVYGFDETDLIVREIDIVDDLAPQEVENTGLFTYTDLTRSENDEFTFHNAKVYAEPGVDYTDSVTHPASRIEPGTLLDSAVLKRKGTCLSLKTGNFGFHAAVSCLDFP